MCLVLAAGFGGVVRFESAVFPVDLLVVESLDVDFDGDAVFYIINVIKLILYQICDTTAVVFSLFYIIKNLHCIQSSDPSARS